MFILPHPTLPELPDSLETARFLLRPPRIGDGRIINDAIRESFETLTRWMPWARTMPSFAESETFARENATRFRTREAIPMLILRKSDRMLMGISGMHNIDWALPRFEIGYWLRDSAVGSGIMTETVERLTEFCFADLNAERVEIRCDTANLRSAAVATRTRFTREGILRRDRRDNAGALSDTLVFSRIRAEWKAEKKDLVKKRTED